MRFLTLLIVLFLSVHLIAQDESIAIDTLYTRNGKIVVFQDRTWQYLSDLEFDGILNERLLEEIEQRQLNYIQTWDNDVCYTSDRQNDLSLLPDTLWLCVNDDIRRTFHPPVDGLITSRYGYRSGRYHNGIDIDLETGDFVRACWDGKVRYAQFNHGGFGNLVILRHYNGLETFYAHLSKIIVQPNDEVRAGDIIGLGGNTGRSRGSHLHFEVRFFDAPMNPEEIIDFDRGACKDDNLFVHRSLFRPGAKPTDEEEHGESPVYAKKTTNARKYYRVRSGDTLSKIARQYGTTVNRLCQLNGIRASSPLHIGRTLRVK